MIVFNMKLHQKQD